MAKERGRADGNPWKRKLPNPPTCIRKSHPPYLFFPKPLYRRRARLPIECRIWIPFAKALLLLNPAGIVSAIQMPLARVLSAHREVFCGWRE